MKGQTTCRTTTPKHGMLERFIGKNAMQTQASTDTPGQSRPLEIGVLTPLLNVRYLGYWRVLF